MAAEGFPGTVVKGVYASAYRYCMPGSQPAAGAQCNHPREAGPLEQQHCPASSWMISPGLPVVEGGELLPELGIAADGASPALGAVQHVSVAEAAHEDDACMGESSVQQCQSILTCPSGLARGNGLSSRSTCCVPGSCVLQAPWQDGQVRQQASQSMAHITASSCSRQTRQ